MNENSVPPFSNANAGQLLESFGITRLDATDATEWNQTIGGLIFQGGKTPVIPLDTTYAVSYSVEFPKAVLGVFLGVIGDGVLQSNLGIASPYNITTTGFTILQDAPDAAFYWLAIGL